jgi:hypothetical protein
MAEEKKLPKAQEVALLEESRKGLKVCIDNEAAQRALMQDDLDFACLDQWPADIRTARENDILNGPRPCLTIDQINQYITQVSNEMRRNRPAIKTRPVDDVADPKTAEIYQGLIRHIEDQSSAQIAYSTSGESAVTIGVGFFRIVADYVSHDSFDRELLIKRVPDTFSVYLGAHAMPDGSDAECGWVFEHYSMDRFKREFPGANTDPAAFEGIETAPEWMSKESVTVCEYFHKKHTSIELVFLADGRTIEADAYDAIHEPKPDVTGRRESAKTTVMWCKHTGVEILDRREFKGKYIPIVEVVGKEKIVKGKRVLWGLVRPAKDSLRAFNYWISAMTEKMALAPKAPFIGAVGQFATFGDRWDKANVNNYAKLEYDAVDHNGNAAPAPRRQEPMQMEPAMAQMLSIMQNNVKSSLGMYKAALGETESQQSGRAILALQKESDTGTMHFGENQALSIMHGGRILVDLIPHYYDTRRVLRILGEDGKGQNAEIDPAQTEAMREVRGTDGNVRRIHNLGVGKYDVTVSVGPGYTTSRQEAATVMTELANSAKDPISAAIMRYGAVKNSDFAGSEEIQKMLKAMLPPQLQQAEGDGEKMPPAAMAKIAQLTQAAQGLQAKLQEVGQENQELKAGSAEGMAKVNADHDAKMQALALEEKVEAEKARIARKKADDEIELKRAVAEADYEIEQRKLSQENDAALKKLDFDRQCRMDDKSKESQAADAVAAESLAPNLIQSMQGIVREFAAVIQQQQQFQKQLIEQMARQNGGRHISMKMPDGRTATADVTLQ